jgi:hypothetical protein
MLDGLTLFAAQQQVNDWQRQYGTEQVRMAQAEIDRRRAKRQEESDDDEEHRWYAELNNGYAKDRI